MAGPKINNVIRIPSSIDKDFFRLWIEFLTPLHNLTFKEKDVLAAFIKKRFELTKSVNDESLIDKILFSRENVAEVKKDCNISNSYYKLVMVKLRKTKAISDGKINPKFIPKNLSFDDKSFQLLFFFDLNGRDV